MGSWEKKNQTCKFPFSGLTSRTCWLSKKNLSLVGSVIYHNISYPTLTFPFYHRFLTILSPLFLSAFFGLFGRFGPCFTLLP